MELNTTCSLCSHHQDLVSHFTFHTGVYVCTYLGMQLHMCVQVSIQVLTCAWRRWIGRTFDIISQLSSSLSGQLVNFVLF